MADRENFFFLLNLPYDPPENDPAVIQKAISAFRRQIESDSRIPGREEKAAARRALVPELQRVMTDPALRRAEAEQAKGRYGQVIEQLKQEVKNLTVAGFMTPEERDELEKKYAAYGITKEYLNSLLKHVKISSGASERSPGLPEGLRQQLEAHLSRRGFPYRSLYDFLGKPETTKTTDMLAAAAKRADNILKSVSPQQKDLEDNELCDLCRRIFADEQTRQLYDSYLKTNRFLELNRWLLSQTKKTGNVMTNDLLNTALAIGAEKYADVSEKTLREYLQEVCKENGIAFLLQPNPTSPAPNPSAPAPAGSAADLPRQRAAKYAELARNALCSSNWVAASDLLTRGIREDPIYGELYLLLLMLEKQVTTESDLGTGTADLRQLKAWPMALQYGDNAQKRRLEKYARQVDVAIANKKKQERHAALDKAQGKFVVIGAMLLVALAYAGFFVTYTMRRVHWTWASPSPLGWLLYFLPVLFSSLAIGLCHWLSAENKSKFGTVLQRIFVIAPVAYSGYVHIALGAVASIGLALIFILFMAVLFVIGSVCALPGVFVAGTAPKTAPSSTRKLFRGGLIALVLGAGFYLCVGPAVLRPVNTEDLLRQAQAAEQEGDPRAAAAAYWLAGEYQTSQELCELNTLFGDGWAILPDGSVSPKDDDFIVSGWTDVKTVFRLDRFHLFGLRQDGTILLACDHSTVATCYRDTIYWTDITQLVSWQSCAVGLRADGTVVCSGELPESASITEWTDVSRLTQYDDWLVGLRSSGGMYVAGDTELPPSMKRLGGATGPLWAEIPLKDGAVCYNEESGYYSAFAVTESGELLCDDSITAFDSLAGQNDVVQLCSTGDAMLILRADGSVLSFGLDELSEMQLALWNDVALLAASEYNIVGLRANGSLLSLGCVEPIFSKPIVAIAPVDYGAICLHLDGTLTIVDNDKEESLKEWMKDLNLFVEAAGQEGV